MKESIEKNGTIIREWTFDEWKQGISPINFQGLITDSTGKLWRNVISDEDYQKLRKEQKMHYQESVKKSFENKMDWWKRKLERSKDEVRLRSKEIAAQEKIINKPSGVVRSSFERWEEYDEVITEGKDGSVNHHPYHNNNKPNATNYIQVEAIKLFVDHLKKSHQKPADKLKPMISYQWNSNQDEDLPVLYTAMKETYKLIDQSTTLEQFKAVFTGQPIDDIKPVKWIEKPVLLAYFIKKLQCKLNGFPDLWSIGEKCFEGTTRKNLESAYQNTLNNKTEKPKRHQIIDSLF